MFKSFSFSNLTAGFVAVIVGLASSVVIIMQAATAAGATPHEVGSWLLALGIGMGATGIGLSLYYRVPILIAWSTPGAALLITSLTGVPMSHAIGAFIFSAILITLSGVTGLFQKIIANLPQSISCAMLVGILLHFGTDIFVTMQHQTLLVCAMLFTYLFGKRLFPRLVIILTLLVGMVIASKEGLFHLAHFNVALSSPVFTMPVFSWQTLISIGIPLFIVTMTTQNVTGIAIIRAAGYRTPVSSIISWTGIANLLLAPFGGFAINTAVITGAICVSEEAHPNPAMRYQAAVYAGIFYMIAGIFGATVVTFFSSLPHELIMTIAGIALLGALSNSLKIAMEEDTQREPALITLLVSASGISLFGIGAAFWGLMAGVLSYNLLNIPKERFYGLLRARS